MELAPAIFYTIWTHLPTLPERFDLDICFAINLTTRIKL